MQKSWPRWLGLAVGLAAVLAGLVIGADQVEQWRLAARWTARVGFPFLLLAYVARPLTQLWPSKLAKGLLQRRKYLGLGCALCHTVHLGALITFFVVIDETPDLIAIIGGGWGYLLMFAMALTSNRTAMKAMGKWWKRLHWAGIHTLWAIFLVTYAGRLEDADTYLLGVITVSALLLAGTIRILAWIKTKRRRI
jgi:DMSO/TMAO reductase YedYZ heme-binding membrane subunit